MKGLGLRIGVERGEKDGVRSAATFDRAGHGPTDRPDAPCPGQYRRRGGQGLLLVRRLGVRPGVETTQDLLAAEVVAGEACGGKLALHDDLRRDARMVEAGEPEGGLAQHAVPSGQGVLDRRALGVAEVELAGHVRRRLNDDKGALPRLDGGGEVAGVHPLLVEALLYGGRVIGAGKLLGSLEGHGAACSMGLAAKPEHGAPSIVPHGATLHGGAWDGRVRCWTSHQFESSRVEFFRGEETTSPVA